VKMIKFQNIVGKLAVFSKGEGLVLGMLTVLLGGCASSGAQLESAFAYASTDNDAVSALKKESHRKTPDLRHAENERDKGKVEARSEFQRRAGTDRAEHTYLPPSALYSVEPANERDLKNTSHDVVADNLLTWTDKTPVYLRDQAYYEELVDKAPAINLQVATEQKYETRSDNASEQPAAKEMASIPVLGHWELSKIISEEVCNTDSGSAIPDCKPAQ